MKDGILEKLLICISSLFDLFFKPTQVFSSFLFVRDEFGICSAELHKLFVSASLNNITML